MDNSDLNVNQVTGNRNGKDASVLHWTSEGASAATSEAAKDPANASRHLCKQVTPQLFKYSGCDVTTVRKDNLHARHPWSQD